MKKILIILIILFTGCIGDNECHNLEKEYQRDQCYKEKGECEKISDMNQVNDCLKRKAIEEINPNICDKIEDNIQIDSCIIQFADNLDNVCEKINDEIWRDECLLKSLEKSSGQSCQTIIDENKKLECYVKSSIFLNNSNFCDEMNLPNQTDTCKFRASTKILSISSCKNIVDKKIRRKCISSIAMKNITTDECIDPNNQYEQDLCLRTIGEVKRNLSICQMVNLQGHRESCFMHIAIKEKNSTICDNVEGEHNHDSCLKKINS